MVFAVMGSGCAYVELREASRRPRKVVTSTMVSIGSGYKLPMKITSFTGGKSLGTIAVADFRRATGVHLDTGAAVKLSTALSKQLINKTWKGKIKKDP